MESFTFSEKSFRVLETVSKASPNGLGIFDELS